MKIKVRIFAAGYSTRLEKGVVRGGKLRRIKVPNTVALIEHPEFGLILFDTGYADNFFVESRKFPYWLYNRFRPVVYDKSESVRERLVAQGINPEEISYVILSHFHADHIGGCCDFPKASFICSRVGYEKLRHKRGIRALPHGFIPDLLPEDFMARAEFFEDKPVTDLPLEDSPFWAAVDLFGDKTIYGVYLPGHMKGHFGLFVKTGKSEDEQYFFVADACGSKATYVESRLPFTRMMHRERKNYQDSLNKINLLYRRYPTLNIIPSHCAETIESFRNSLIQEVAE